MAKITEIKSDMKKVENGVLVDYAAGIKLRIASSDNLQYKNYRDRLLKPHTRRIRSKSITSSEILDIIKPAAAKHLLVGWENIEDENGQPIPYSEAKAFEFFQDPTLSDLYSFVTETAGEAEVFRLELMKDAEGN